LSVRYLPDGTVQFRVGPPFWVGILVLLIFLGLSLAFLVGAALGDIDELKVFGYRVFGPVTATAAGYLMAAVMALGALGTGIGLRRKVDDANSIRLEKERIVISGVGLSGEERKVHYRDIESLGSLTERGGRILKVQCRDGSKIELPSALFMQKGAFETFWTELEDRVEQARS
jgi:hypothetical protein